jgi:hypothetical protein
MEKSLNKTVTTILDSYHKNIKFIDDHLPDIPFIAFFGSSHTYGWCEMNGKEELDDSQIWATILAKKLNVPFVNFGTPGVVNEETIQQIMDFIAAPKSKNCLFAFLEIRMAERTISLSNDLMFDDFGSLPVKTIHSQLIESREIRKSYKHFRNTGSRAFVTRFPLVDDPKKKHKQIENVLRSAICTGDKVIPTDLIKFVERRRDVYIEGSTGQIEPYYDDFNRIRTMTTLLSLHGINSRWFCWDSVLHGKAKELSYQWLKEKLSLVNNAIDNEIKSLSRGATTEYYKIFNELPPRCDCGHTTSEFHSWIADMIYEEVKDILK